MLTRVDDMYICMYVCVGVTYSLSHSPCCVRAQGMVHYTLDCVRKGCWEARAERTRTSAGINLSGSRCLRLIGVPERKALPEFLEILQAPGQDVDTRQRP